MGGLFKKILFLGSLGVFSHFIPLSPLLYYNRASFYRNVQPYCDFIAYHGYILFKKNGGLLLTIILPCSDFISALLEKDIIFIINDPNLIIFVKLIY